jgi:hypothetical protein
MTTEYPKDAMTEVCELLMDEYGLTLKQINSLARHLPAKCSDIDDARNEAAWERQQQSLMESGGTDDSHYRQSLKDAGRGHLLR